MQKLQVLQNKALRLLSGLEYGTPTETLLKHCNELSVHQLLSYHTSCQVYKVKTTKLPSYHYNRLFNNNNKNINQNTRGASTDIQRVEFNLSLGRSHFFYQASKIWSLLYNKTTNAQTIKVFKDHCKKWTQENVSIKP